MHLAYTARLDVLFFGLVAFHCVVVAAQTAQVVTVQAPRPTHEPSFVTDGDFVAAVLNSSNLYRYEHGVLPLAWNDTLAEFAQNWTEPCEFKHSGGPYGENLAEGFDNVTASIEGWGDERTQYDFERPDFAEATGHFTQLVWNTTRTVGCGRKLCDSGVGGWYLVCEYWPRGNVLGGFAQHVPRQQNTGAGFVFQNCTTTGNCSTVVSGYPADDDGSGGSSSSGGPRPSSTGGGGGRGNNGNGSGNRNDGSRLIVGPLMAGIIILATGLSLWEPLQLRFSG